MYPEGHSNQDKRMEKLDVLSDPKARKILRDCRHTSRSIEELSRIHRIPLNICHRIASVLQEFDLIREDEVVQKGEREVSLYRTVTENTSVVLSEKELKINLEFSDRDPKLSLA